MSTREHIASICNTPGLQREFGFQLARLLGEHTITQDSFLMRYQCAMATDDLLDKALSMTIPSQAKS